MDDASAGRRFYVRPVSAPLTLIVIGGHAPVALDPTRHFARAGHRVVAGESVAFPLTRASRAVVRSVRVPPLPPPEAVLDAVKRLVAGEQVALVVPTCEETFAVSRLPACSEPVFTGPPRVLKRLHDKGRFAERASALGLPAVGQVLTAATFAARALRALRAGVSPLAVTTRDIEWDGEPDRATDVEPSA